MDNLEPGTPAPEAGEYICGYCGPGGLAESMAAPLRLLERGDSQYRQSDLRTAMSSVVTVCTVEQGEPLPLCAFCVDATGWGRLTGSLRKHLRRRIEIQEGLLAQLGLVRSEPLDSAEIDLDRLVVRGWTEPKRRWWQSRS